MACRRRTTVSFAALAMLASLFTPAVAATQPAQAARPTACADVLFIGARGSGEKLPGESNEAYAGYGPRTYAVLTGLRQDLGDERSVRAHYVPYPVEPVTVLRPTDKQARKLAAAIARGANPAAWLRGAISAVGVWRDWKVNQLGVYFASADIGSAAVYTMLLNAADRCPHEQIVLAGYSQGAMAVHQGLAKVAKKGRDDILLRVAGVALIADGDRLRGTAARSVGSAGRSKGVRTFFGFGKQRDVPGLVRGRTLDICDDRDLVCDFGARRLLDFKEAKEVHGGYVDRGDAAGRRFSRWVRNYARPTSPRWEFAAEVGDAFDQQLTASARRKIEPRWRVAEGALPPGIRLRRSGRLSGVATDEGRYSATVEVRGRYQVWVPSRLVIQVGSPIPPAGRTWLVSVTPDGTPANRTSYRPSISADGRHVAFTSAADNIVPGDTNRTDDVFVHTVR